MIDWLIIYGFTSRSRIFQLYGDITINGEGLQNLGLCSALRAFEQGGIFMSVRENEVPMVPRYSQNFIMGRSNAAENVKKMLLSRVI